MLSFVLTMQ